MSWGERFVGSNEFKTLNATEGKRGRAVVEFKATINPMTTAIGSGSSLIAPQYETTPLSLPMRQMTVRQLLNVSQTAANTIYYSVQTVRTNNAATVAEGALKPQSDLQYAQKNVPVQTIAHFIKGSRQLMDDAPALASLIDTELRYMVDFVEENQILYGDGTGNNLMGIIPQATPYAAPFTSAAETSIDRLNQAIAQSELALLPATGIIMNTVDWRALIGLKDGQGRYLSNGPFGGGQARTVWDLPVAPTLALQQGTFLVGAFGIGAQLYDRLTTEVLLSTEDADNFQRNLVTVRGEKRVALAVKRPQAFVVGTLN